MYFSALMQRPNKRYRKHFLWWYVFGKAWKVNGRLRGETMNNSIANWQHYSTCKSTCEQLLRSTPRAWFPGSTHYPRNLKSNSFIGLRSSEDLGGGGMWEESFGWVFFARGQCVLRKWVVEGDGLYEFFGEQRLKEPRMSRMKQISNSFNYSLLHTSEFLVT